MVEAHPPGPPLTPQQQEGSGYHPVRRRGEAAAMVDIGHGKEDSLAHRESPKEFGTLYYCKGRTR